MNVRHWGKRGARRCTLEERARAERKLVIDNMRGIFDRKIVVADASVRDQPADRRCPVRVARCASSIGRPLHQSHRGFELCQVTVAQEVGHVAHRGRKRVRNRVDCK